MKISHILTAGVGLLLSSLVAAATAQEFVEIKMVPVDSAVKPMAILARMEVFDPPVLLERGDPMHKLRYDLPWLPAYRVQCHYADYSYTELSRFYTKEFIDENGITSEVIASLKKNYPEGGPSGRLASVLWAVEAEMGGDHYWTVAIYQGAHLRKLPTSFKEIPRGITIFTFVREGDLWKQTPDRNLWFLRFPMDSAAALQRAFEAHEVRVYLK